MVAHPALVKSVRELRDLLESLYRLGASVDQERTDAKKLFCNGDPSQFKSLFDGLIDSIVDLKRDLSIKMDDTIDTLKSEIASMDKNIGSLDDKIGSLRNELNEKIDNMRKAMVT